MHTVDLYDAWVEPSGIVHPVSEEGHSRFASGRGTSGDALLRQGWIKISSGDWFGTINHTLDFDVTQQQFDFIYQWHQDNGKTFHAGRYIVR